MGSAPADWTLARVADINGDGRTDILWRHTTGLLAGWLMDGLGVITSALMGSAATSWQIQ